MRIQLAVQNIPLLSINVHGFCSDIDNLYSSFLTLVICVLFVWKLINFTDLFKKAGFKRFIYLLFDLFFRLLWISVAMWTLFSCGEGGLLSSGSVLASHGSGFPGCDAQALGHSGFSSCGTWAQELQSRALEHRLSSCGTWTSLLHNM